MDLSINHKSSIPLHKQIEQKLRVLIESNQFENGKLFPKEVELSNRFGVSRNTVRQGINTLVQEGLLERKKGIGTTVKNNHITTQLSRWHSFTHEMNEKGIPFKNFHTALTTISLNEERGAIFNVKKGKKAQKLVRVRGSLSAPFVYFVSWFHPRIQFDESEAFQQPLYEIIEKNFSISPKKSSEELTAILADSFLAEILRVEEKAPLLFRKRIVYDVGGRAIEINYGYYRADRFSYKIDFDV